jgi:hypothetical protein
MMMDSIALFRLYEKFNLHYFGAALPYCPIIWSRQLTRTAGNIDVFTPKMKLSYPLLVEAFEPKGLFRPEFEICGVRCDSSQRAIEEIVKHEMIHLWLHEQGLPSGHTAEVRAKARQMGQPKRDIKSKLPNREPAGNIAVLSAKVLLHAANVLAVRSPALRVVKNIIEENLTRGLNCAAKDWASRISIAKDYGIN